jgi:hypothetical protein
MAAAPPHGRIVHIVSNPLTHELIALTDQGEMWERILDTRHFGNTKRYAWRKVPGPEVEAYEVPKT